MVNETFHSVSDRNRSLIKVINLLWKSTIYNILYLTKEFFPGNSWNIYFYKPVAVDHFIRPRKSQVSKRWQLEVCWLNDVALVNTTVRYQLNGKDYCIVRWACKQTDLTRATPRATESCIKCVRNFGSLMMINHGAGWQLFFWRWFPTSWRNLRSSKSCGCRRQGATVISTDCYYNWTIDHH